MSDRLLRELPVRNLEWVFHPPGLPLPDRGHSKPTTSVLVRGPAGTGKTSLALGVAAGIAKALGGRIYYLSTEIAPTDVRFKLEQIGLPRDCAAGRAGVAGHTQVVVEHLLRVAEPTEDGGWRTDAALRHVEGVVVDREVDNLSVVVVDAFSLLGETEAKSSLRLELAAFIQACDTQGISVVLVEEAPGTTAAFLPFVVDVVFELGWGEDPDTHARYRQLAVTKSRFAHAANGPHDFGIERGRLAVWPDLGGVDFDALRNQLRPQHDAVAVLGNGRRLSGLVAISGGDRFVRPSVTPWLRFLDVKLGGVHSIGDRTVSMADGPNAVVWSIINSVSANASDVLMVTGAASVLRRSRFLAPLFGSLAILGEAGLLVAVVGAGDDLRLAPVDFEGKYWSPLPPHRSKTASGSVERLISDPSNPDRPVPNAVQWAALHAIVLGETAPLDWLLGSKSNDELSSEPLVCHGFARVGRIDEAIALLKSPTPRDVADLHLSRLNREGLDAAKAHVSAFLDSRQMSRSIDEVSAILGLGPDPRPST